MKTIEEEKEIKQEDLGLSVRTTRAEHSRRFLR